jgi:hypothetical protein
MEKKGVIEEGTTPPEKQATNDKQASADLAAHLTKRLHEALERLEEDREKTRKKG